MKLPKLLLLSLTASLAFAQQPSQNENSTEWSPVTLAGEFLEHNYINWFAFADGIYDSYAPISTPTGVVNNGSFGWQIGGGVNANHVFRDGQLSLSYRGDYRDYQNLTYANGTDQNLGISYSKRFARRWTFNATVSGGITFYGGTFFSATPGTSNVVPNNPFSDETKYLSTGASITYQQTRRLSYVLGGGYFLQRYNYPGAIGSEGASVSASAFYRLTARTTVGGTYSYNHFTFQRAVGEASGNSLQASISHQFPDHWTASAAGGVTYSNTSGIAILPLNTLIPQAVLPVGIGPGDYIAERYNESTSFPSFSGTVARAFHHSNLYVSGGQGLSAGNGYYLASKALYLSGVYSIAIAKRQSISASGGYSRLSSVSNTISALYSSSSLSVAYGVTLVRFFGLNARYDYIHYGTLNPNPAINDNRLSFGLTFSSKSIPLTLF